MVSAPDLDEKAALSRLRSELGEVVSTDAALLDSLRTDKSGWRSEGGPIAVVLATEVRHVQSALRIASELGLAVVPRGAGTGLAGGGVATPGSLVVSTEGMDRILELNLEDELAVVQPGVINQRLSDEVAPYGLVFSPDPASKAISTIGGRSSVSTEYVRGSKPSRPRSNWVREGRIIWPRASLSWAVR
jgi:glycolate oxidase